jgi:hypothetical protein
MDLTSQPAVTPGRDFISRNAPLLVLLTAYLILTVLMNIVFAVYDDSPALSSVKPFSIRDFPISTLGYWALLFLPFLLVPPIAIFVRKASQRWVAGLVGLLPEFRLFDYLLITCIGYAIVVAAMIRADALELLFYGSDPVSVVEARFELLSRLHNFERAILQSALVFLTLYSLVRAMRCRSWVWLGFFAINLIAMATLLIVLNMKWPVIVLFGGVVAATVLFGRRRLLYTALGIGGMLCVYFLVATVVLRIPQPGASQDERAGRVRNEAVTTVQAPAASHDDHTGLSVKGTVLAAIPSSRWLIVTGLVRMAIPYPFYYRTFTSEGPICGTILDRLEKHRIPCEPTQIIYERMFGDDGFTGRGTAPAPFHTTGYALDGWPGAIIETILTAIVIGMFMAVPAHLSPLAGTITVMGVLTAYFFSQLPFEGPILFDHGCLWWVLLVAGYALVRSALGARVWFQRA